MQIDPGFHALEQAHRGVHIGGAVGHEFAALIPGVWAASDREIAHLDFSCRRHSRQAEMIKRPKQTIPRRS